MALGKYEHEIYDGATNKDIIGFIALRNVQHKEKERARRRQRNQPSQF